MHRTPFSVWDDIRHITPFPGYARWYMYMSVHTRLRISFPGYVMLDDTRHTIPFLSYIGWYKAYNTFSSICHSEMIQGSKHLFLDMWVDTRYTALFPGYVRSYKEANTFFWICKMILGIHLYLDTSDDTRHTSFPSDSDE